MRFRTAFILAILLSAAPALRAAYPAITGANGGTVDGNANTWVVTWTDSTGNPRQLYLMTNNPGATRMTYYIAGALVTDDEEAGHFIGQLVDHGGNGAVASGGTPSTMGAILTGPNHYIYRYTFLFGMNTTPACNWQITEDWEFVNGRDDFLETVTYDSSNWNVTANGNMSKDLRSPYNDTSWAGSGGATGVAWGDAWSFATTSPISGNTCGSSCGFSCGPAEGSTCTVNWTWGPTANLIPYAWEWSSPAQGGAVDREFANVQNTPDNFQDFGGGYYGLILDNGNMPSVAQISAGATGTSMGECWAVPTQMSCYDSDWDSTRVTWGTTYNEFINGHENDRYTQAMGNIFFPVAGFSWMFEVDAYSNKGTPKLITDTANVYASTFSATTGSIALTGPLGPGNYIGPGVNNQVTPGVMPTVTYPEPGFDYIYRAWTVNASAAGAVACDLNVGGTGTLYKPTLRVKNTTALPCLVTLNGVDQVSGTDYLATYDSATGSVWITFQKTLAAGANNIDVQTACGSPTPTHTPCAACTPTPSDTPTPTETATPALCPQLIYNGEAGAGNFNMADATAAGGYAWAQPTGAGSTCVENTTGACCGLSDGFDVTLEWAAGSYWGGFDFDWNIPYNLSTATSLQFDVASAAGTLTGLTVELLSNTGATGTVSLTTYLPGGVTTAWHLVTVPMSAFTGLTLQAITQIEFQDSSSSSGDETFYLDNIQAVLPCGAGTPTDSPTTVVNSPTRSPTGSVTATPTATRSSTSSSTPSPTATFTLSSTLSPTRSSTWTPSQTATPLGTSTGTPTQSPSFSPSPTLTPSSSWTYSPSPSPSCSATPSASPSPTLSASPSLTASFTASPTPSPSGSVTLTGTITSTLSATPTISVTPTISDTGTSSPTLTQSPTVSVTPTISDTGTPSPTFSGSPSLTATGTATVTSSATSSVTDSPTLSATRTITGTYTPGPTLTRTSTQSPSPSPSAVVPAGAGGPVAILDLLPFPNPNPKVLAVLLNGSADRIDVKIYTTAFVMVGASGAGPFPSGWAQVPLPTAWLESAPNGRYYLRATATRGSAVSPAVKPAKAFMLR